LDDTLLKTIEIAEQPELQQAREVVLRMRRRQLYQVYLCDINSGRKVQQNRIESGECMCSDRRGYSYDAACFVNVMSLNELVLASTWS